MNDTKAKVVRLSTGIVAAAVFFLLIAGALVTSTESGLAVPDWPLSYGRFMPPMVGGIFYEHGHRLVAAAVSTLVGLQMAVLLWGEKRRALRRAGVLAFAAILCQAILGGLTVIFLLPPAVSSAHAGLAEIVFALTACLAWTTARRWTSGAIVEDVSPSDGPLLASAYRLTLAAAGAVYVQILLGAVMRHTGAGLAIPDFPLAFGSLVPAASSFARRGVPIHFAHRLGAIAVTVLVGLAARRLHTLRKACPALASLGAAWIALLVVQLTLGAFSIWSKKAVAVTTAHLAVGALCWLTGVLAAVTLAKCRTVAGVNSAPERRRDALKTPQRLGDYLELTKPRITLFVVMTAFVGFVAGTKGPLSGIDFLLLAHTLVGTALVASGTSAFNQVSEVELDGRMGRTSSRPLPSGRLPVRNAALFAGALSILGVAELYFFTNPLTALLAAITLVSYVGLYTPLKTISPVSTLVGAVPGALPPLGGFTAAHGAIAGPGLALFAILFLWQMPHFFAIGWRHRVDYGRAGVRILPTLDPTGRSTGWSALAYCLALLPASLLPALFGTAGSVYAVGALCLSLIFLAASFRFALQTTDERALTLFLVSIAWLPAVLLLLVADRITG
jgi:protoheme IX farnesyltransferase